MRLTWPGGERKRRHYPADTEGPGTSSYMAEIIIHTAPLTRALTKSDSTISDRLGHDDTMFIPDFSLFLQRVFLRMTSNEQSFALYHLLRGIVLDIQSVGWHILAQESGFLPVLSVWFFLNAHISLRRIFPWLI